MVVKHMYVTTDQYGKVDLPIGSSVISVYPKSSQYGIFQYSVNGIGIRIFDIGTGVFSFAANKQIEIYVVFAKSVNLEN